MNKETLNEYKTFLAMKHRKKWTRDSYYRRANAFLQYLDKPAQEINKKDVQQWLAHENTSNYRHNGIVSRIIGVNKFLDWLDKHDLRIITPAWEEYHRRTIDFETIQKLLQTSKAMHPVYELLLRFIIDLDARPGEIIDAKFSNILDDKIYFDDTKTGDNYGFVTSGFLNALERYKPVRPKPKPEYDDYILIGQYSHSKGKKFTHNCNTLLNKINAIAYKADIGRRLTPYDLRASVMTEEYNHFVNPKTIQRKARHSSPKTTMRYNHINDQTVKDYVNYDFIFDKEPLQGNDRKRSRVKVFLSPSISSQGLNKTFESEDNTTVSFSTLSFLEQLMGVRA